MQAIRWSAGLGFKEAESQEKERESDRIYFIVYPIDELQVSDIKAVYQEMQFLL